MNKTELTERIARDCNVSLAAASRMLESALANITHQLKRGGAVQLTGFGTFRTARRAARIGRNPRTGEALKIRAAKVPKFAPGKALKDALN